MIVITRGQSPLVAAGVVGGLLLGPWWISPELSGVAMLELPSLIAEHWPELILGLILLYALIALLLTTLLLIARMMQVRTRSTEVVTRDQLLSVFAQSGPESLGPRIIGSAASEGPMRKVIRIGRSFSFLGDQPICRLRSVRGPQTEVQGEGPLMKVAPTP
jgi:hypothetical protein